MNRALVLSILLCIPVASAWGGDFHEVRGYRDIGDISRKDTMGDWQNGLVAFLEAGALGNLGRAAKRNQAVRPSYPVRRASQVILNPGIRQGLYDYQKSQSKEYPSLSEALSACGQETDAPLNAALLSTVDVNSDDYSDYPHCNLDEYIVIRNAVIARQN